MVMNETEILKIRAKARVNQAIMEGHITVNGKKYKLIHTNILGLFSMLSPAEFIQMPEEYTKIKYPSAFRPQLIITDPEDTVNLTYSYISDEDFLEDELADWLNKIHNTIKNYNPATIFWNEGILDCNYQKVAYIEYRSRALDDDLFNLAFATSLKGKLFYGCFICINQLEKYWKDIFHKLLSTIQPIMEDVT